MNAGSSPGAASYPRIPRYADWRSTQGSKLQLKELYGSSGARHHRPPWQVSYPSSYGWELLWIQHEWGLHNQAGGLNVVQEFSMMLFDCINEIKNKKINSYNLHCTLFGSMSTTELLNQQSSFPKMFSVQSFVYRFLAKLKFWLRDSEMKWKVPTLPVNHPPTEQ